MERTKDDGLVGVPENKFKKSVFRAFTILLFFLVFYGLIRLVLWIFGSAPA